MYFLMQILDAMNQDSGIPLTQLQVDGGMTSNRLLMQLQADILCIPVGETAVHVFSCVMLKGNCGIIINEMNFPCMWLHFFSSTKNIKQTRHFLTKRYGATLEVSSPSAGNTMHYL